jgi:hypothetical protein
MIQAVCIILLLPAMCFGQLKVDKSQKGELRLKPKLKLAFTRYNHAERIYDGVTTYTLKDSLIELRKQYLGDKKSKLIYSNTISNLNELLLEFKKVRLDSLDTYYFNKCIMTTSGDEYFFDFKYEPTKKSISLHAYYIKEIAEAVKLINSTLPEKYQFRYASEDNKQNCK